MGPLDTIVEFISKFPAIQSPEVFGLHPNADLTKDQNETIQLFSSIISTRSGGGGGGSSSGDDQLLVDISSDILAKLPSDYNMEHACKKFPTLPTESMNTVLQQELIRFNSLIQVIRTSLKDIQLALKGLVVMSAELDAVGKSLSVGIVPAMWMSVSYPNLKPLAGYVADLLERLAFFQKWLDKGKPATFWFSGFFFQPSFLTGALQNFARKYAFPIDSCSLEYIFQQQGLQEKEWEPPEDGVYVYGLFMEGARFNRDTMLVDESLPKRLYDEMPVALIRPCQTVNWVQYEHYECPLYKTLERRGVLATSGHSTNFVMEVNVPSDKPQQHWIKRGVAMFCALRDA